MLVGDTHASDGGHPNPGGLIPPDLLPEGSFLLKRWCVLLLLSVFVYLPFLSCRNLSSLNALNSVGVAALALFALCSVWLAVAAAWQRKGYWPEMLPDMERLGDSPLAVLASTASVMSVMGLSFACHTSVFPLMTILRPFSTHAMVGGWVGRWMGTTNADAMVVVVGEMGTTNAHAMVVVVVGEMGTTNAHAVVGEWGGRWAPPTYMPWWWWWGGDWHHQRIRHQAPKHMVTAGWWQWCGH